MSIVQTIDGELRVSSLTIAERTEVEHRAVLQLIRQNRTELEALGDLAFEMRDRPTGVPGPAQQFAHLNEPQATFLITLMRNSDIVKAFKLELVRQFYEMRQALAKPAELSRSDLARLVLAAEAEREALAAKVAEDAPKVEYVDRHVAPAGDAITFRDAAAHLGVGEKALREALVDGGWIYRFEVGREWSASEQRLVPRFEWRAKSAHSGKFSLRAQHNAPRYHNGQVRQTLYVLAGGLDAIRRKLARAGVTPALGRALAAVEDHRDIAGGEAA